MNGFLDKLARGRKAVVGFFTQVAALVVFYVPDAAEEVKLGMGLLVSIIGLALLYRVPNKPKRQ